MVSSYKTGKRERTVALVASGIALILSACNSNQHHPNPIALEKLKERGVVIVDTFTTPSGTKAWAGYMQDQPMAFYATPDGKHIIAGTMIDSSGKDVNRESVDRIVRSAMLTNVWEQVEKSHWISDGNPAAPRKVYVFTDVNCGFCSRLVVDARPWVESGKVELRHIMVGIISENSPAKAATVLADEDPAYKLVRHAHYVRSGRQSHLKRDDIEALSAIPVEIMEKLEANHRLMGSLRLQATPSLVWLDENGSVQVRQGASPETLSSAFGPR